MLPKPELKIGDFVTLEPARPYTGSAHTARAVSTRAGSRALVVEYGLGDPDEIALFAAGHLGLGRRLEGQAVLRPLAACAEPGAGRAWVIEEHCDGIDFPTFYSAWLRRRVGGALPLGAALFAARSIAEVRPWSDHHGPSPQHTVIGFDGSVRRQARVMASFRRAREASLLPPERVVGEPTGAPAAVYTAGLVLFVLLSGRHPVVAAGESNAVVALQAILSARRRQFAPFVRI